MFKIRRIFWKIFLAFWLTNISVVAVVTLVVVGSLEGEKFRSKHRGFVNDLASRIVNQHERQQTSNAKRTHRLHMPFRRALGPRLLRIYDDDNRLVFSNRAKPPAYLPIQKLAVKSESGRNYLVETTVGAPPHFIVEMIKRLHVLHFVAVLVASGVVSFFLSWSITRPLKGLGDYSRHYADNVNAAPLDRKLLARGDEIGDLARDFDLMRNKVETNISNQKQLLYDVSYELRAPLARLQAAIALLQKKPGVNNFHAERIHLECGRIDALIQKILDYSRMEQVQEKILEVDIVEFIDEHLQHLRFEFPDREINFIDKPVCSHKSFIYKNFLDQALNNVLRNACLHTPEGSPIELCLAVDEEKLTLTVRDHGPGVPVAELKQLLTPFYRAGNAMHSEGHGLGLSIAQRAMERHGGHLNIVNCAEGGLVVELSWAPPKQMADIA